MKPLLLFDVDGTLLHTRGAGLRAMKVAIDEIFGFEIDWSGISTAGRLDPGIFAEVATRNGVEPTPENHSRFRDRYVEALSTELAFGNLTSVALPGIPELLSDLRERRDLVLGLLTGNYASAIPVKLGAAGIDPAWFPIRAFGDEAPTRPEMAALAIRRYAVHADSEVDPSRVVVVGDTPRDVECAHANGCLAFCVATGRFSEDDLREAGADVVVPDLADASPLLDLVARIGDVSQFVRLSPRGSSTP